MAEILGMLYPWVKALHIMAVISWMAGLFYLPRLFVYHAERATVGSELDKTFQVMERKLFQVIMGPAMGMAWLCGLILIATGMFDFGSAWSWIKICAVIGMSWFHNWLGRELRSFENGTSTRSGRDFRLANEVPTVLMVIIVVMVVVRPF